MRARLQVARPEMALTITTVEEQLRGWLAEIKRRDQPLDIIVPYEKLQRQVENPGDWVIHSWDAESARPAHRLHHHRT